MPVVRAKLGEIETTLLADVAQGRMALGALLGDRRLRIYRDGADRRRCNAEPRNTEGSEGNLGALRPCGSGGPIRPIAYGGTVLRREDALFFVID